MQITNILILAHPNSLQNCIWLLSWCNTLKQKNTLVGTVGDFPSDSLHYTWSFALYSSAVPINNAFY